MVSLLAGLPGRTRVGALPLVGLAGIASLAVSLVGLAGLALALVVVQTLDPVGGRSVGDSVVLAGRLWLLAQGGELRIASGPLVLAPLLLTLGLGWGLAQAGRGPLVRIRGEAGVAQLPSGIAERMRDVSRARRQERGAASPR